jgi:site-specific DNA-cytosine methylase
MKILVACEESQRVCQAFRNKGHEAYSCDIIDCSGGHPEWHIKEDVLPLLNGYCTFTTCDGTEHIVDQKWDMIIAFPPCTHLAVSGARHFEKKREDGRQREGIEFFAAFLSADCDKIVIENPIGIIGGEYIKQWFPDLCEKYGLPKSPTQIIHPWQFGDEAEKTTCLWLKGLPKLEPTKIVGKGETFDYVNPKTGGIKHYPKWMMDALKAKTPEERSRLRSKTFKGIAEAMATQWGILEEDKNE